MKYRIHLREVIGDYSSVEWVEDYETAASAWNRIEEVNKTNYGSPDWYLQAKEVVETIDEYKTN